MPFIQWTCKITYFQNYFPKLIIVGRTLMDI